MMKGAYADVVEAAGRTPIGPPEPLAGVEANIYGKLRVLEPFGGSVKDRPAIQIIRDAKSPAPSSPEGQSSRRPAGTTWRGSRMVAVGYAAKTMRRLYKMSEEKMASCARSSKAVVCPTNVEPDDPRLLRGASSG